MMKNMEMQSNNLISLKNGSAKRAKKKDDFLSHLFFVSLLYKNLLCYKIIINIEMY